MKITRVALKILFVILAIGVVLWNSIEWSSQNKTEMANMPFKAGMYDVTVFVLNKDTLNSAFGDSSRWQNMIFDNNHAGSIATADTSFYRRYRRGYFQYKIDTLLHSVSIFKTMADSTMIASFHYHVADKNTIFFWGQQRKDSLHFILKRNVHHFQLTDRQFHWLSEANR